MAITTSSNRLQSLIREAVKDALVSELMKLRADLLPYISADEQRDIRKRYGRPTRRAAKTIKVGI